MTEDSVEMRRIAWSEALPFVRLFRAGKRAVSFTPMMLALGLVLCAYAGGRIVDAIWLAADAGVPWRGEISDVHKYVGPREVLEDWRAAIDAEATGVEMRGPFITLLHYESECFENAVNGVLGGQFGFGGGAFGGQPALLGGVVAALHGLVWTVTQHPWFTLVYGLFALFITALFGGAICRYAAVQAAREENMELRAALRYAREKWIDLAGGPLFLIGMILLGMLLILLGGLIIGWIPYVGEILVGLFYGLTLLGGVALVFALLALVFGTHLMWPTISVEGSDLFDAITRAGGYVFSRAWSVGFYSILLAIYGGICFVFVRLMALLLFKLTHVALAAGMSWFGRIESSGGEGLGKLEGMWALPVWSELPWLPGAGDTPFWGTFGDMGDLRWSESFSMILLMFWVFLVVGLVGAFLVSFYFCGSTEMYFLLRRESDLVDYDEIFYEEDQGLLEPQPEGAEPQPAVAEARGENSAAPGGPAEPSEPPQPEEPSPPSAETPPDRDEGTP